MVLASLVLPVLLSSAVILQTSPTASATQTGTLEGQVLALPDSLPVGDALVQVERSRESRVTDTEGWFVMALPPGSHRLRVEAYGFTPVDLPDVSITDGDTTRITLILEPRPFELAEIVVSPSAFGILREGPASAQTLTRQEVEASPHMGADLFRALGRLPGISTQDISAKLHVRGAPDDQLLTLLDGLELYEPYQMKYWDGSLSVVDPEGVGSVVLLTGGFPAEYGDRLTGVMSMRSRTPDPEPRTALGVSATNTSLFSSGGFADGRGNWLFLARRGFLKYVFAVTGLDSGGELEPDYWDVFGKTSYQLAPGHTLTAHLLATGEKLRAVEEDSTLINGEYGSGYGWLTWNAILGKTLSVETILSAGSVTGDRRGEDDQGNDQSLRVREQRNLIFRGISQKWSYQPTEFLLLRFGGEVKKGEADYSYFRRSTELRPNLLYFTAYPWSLELDRLALTPTPSGTESSIFVSSRARFLERLTADVGFRYDHISYTGDRTLSPRVGVAVEVGAGTVLRTAWGHYYQSQGLHELTPADGDTTFYPAARAEHRIVGLEHRRPGGTTFRIEAYQRLIDDPRPEYRTLVAEVEGLWEESLSDRARIAPSRGYARGLEFLGRGPLGDRSTWAASYVLASSEDKIDGEWVPRPMDQRHTLNLEMAVQPRPTLTFSWAWSYHSPWPYTRETYAVVPVMNGGGQIAFQSAFGPLYGARMPAYHRLDFRATKRFDLRRGFLSVFLDVFNAYNRENPYSVITHAWWLPDQQRAEYLDQVEAQLGVLPTLGIRWEF